MACHHLFDRLSCVLEKKNDAAEDSAVAAFSS